jgi:DHA2 family multidrug resistance protein-like MFS transporter
VAAFACALAQDFQTLLIARTVQSFAGACIMSNNIALIRTIVPGAKLGRAVGFNATSVALASTLGPVVAGSALALADWRSVFAISAPFSVVALVVGLFALPPNEAREGRKFDVGGAILSALAFGFGFVALGGASHDRPLMEIALCAIIGLLAGAMLLHRTRTSANPVLPLDLLKIPIIGLSSAAAVCCFAAEMIAFVAMPFLLESQFGLTSISVGFIIAAWPFAIMLLAPIVGNFADRVAPGPLGAGGLAVMGIGLVLVALLPPDASIANIVWRVAICGVGFVTFQTPNNRTIVASAPRPRSGSAGGLISTSRLTGQTVGTLAVSLALAHGQSWRFTLALAFSAAFAFLGAAFSVQRRGRV